MNAMLLRNLGVGRSGSLQSFSDYRASEARNPQQSSVTSDGALLEYETLELRIHPPNVQVDNEAHDDITVITVDSANRPGTLVEVVQCLTELDLSIRRARISSDGGWFVDEFYVSEISKSHARGKVTDLRKVAAIKKVLNVDLDNMVHSYQPDARDVCTVFQLAGRDRPGLLAAVLQLLTSNGCDVLSAAVWTFHNRVALVVSVTDRGHPVAESTKLERLQQILSDMLGRDDCLVNYDAVKGDNIHHERRLHHLLLLEEDKSWRLQNPPEPEVHFPPPSALAPSASDALQGLGGPDGAGGADGGAGGGPPLPPLPRPPASVVIDAPVFPAAPGISGRTVSMGGSAMGAGASSDAVPQLGGPDAPLSGAPSDAATASALLSASGLLSASSGALLSPSISLSASGANHAATLALLASSRLAAIGAAAAAAATTAAPSTSPSMTSAMAPAPTATLAYEPLALSYQEGHNVAQTGIRADVRIQHSPLLNYWLINIRSKDRNKLFFDTVCALSDMKYDVYHATIDSEGEVATQLFYVRPRYGTAVWDEKRAAKLKYMLESCVQRRFPKGTKVVMHTADRSSMPDLFGAMARATFCITRADVRTSAERATYHFSLTDAKGNEPEPGLIQAVCESQGGVMVDALESVAGGVPAAGVVRGSLSRPTSGGGAPKFSFSVSSLERKWGGPGSGLAPSGGSMTAGNN